MECNVYGRLPSIPEYYNKYINNKVDLNFQPKQCCPFHKEDTPSFSYSIELRRWRCFGSCHCGGDVIDLHKKKFNLANRKVAEESLKKLYGVKNDIKLGIEPASKAFVNEERVEQDTIYQKALLLANTVDRWLDLDYCMSKTPFNSTALAELIEKWEN